MDTDQQEIKKYNNIDYRAVDTFMIAEDDTLKFLLRMNLYTILILVILVFITIFAMWSPGEITVSLWTIGGAIIFGGLYIIIHELLHGITNVICSQNKWDSLAFGFILNQGLAYCISTVPLPIGRIRWSLLMPLIVICLPIIGYGIYHSSMGWTIYGLLLASGSAGDLWYLWKLRNYPKNVYFLENLPQKDSYVIGFMIFEKIEG